MRFRLSTLLAFVAIFGVATAGVLSFTSNPQHIRILIDHIAEIPSPCTAAQFDEAMEKCEIGVTPNQGNDSLLIWHIDSGLVGLKQPNQQSGQQAKPRDGVRYSLMTEYKTLNNSGERLVDVATILKTNLRTGAETRVWAWPDQKQ
jgi:hypothetical protein